MLNPEQKRAVESTGSVCILSGAGTGKTETISRVIAERYRRGTPPERMFVATFTNKAAREMGARVAKHGVPNMPWLGTFHANALRLMKMLSRGGNELPDIVNEDSLMTMIGNNLLPDKEECPELYEKNSGITATSLSRNFLEAVGLLKGDVILPSDMETHEFSDLIKKKIDEMPYLERFIRTRYGLYQDMLRRFHVMDFGDIILFPVVLARQNARAADFMASIFSLVVIDEHQDSCPAQRELAHILSRDSDLVTVGDDGQSIYGWRGADVAGMRADALKDGITAITLFRNYRSTPGILSLGNMIISFDEESLEKTLVADGNNAGEAALPEYRRFQRSQDEVEWISSDIATRIKRGDDPREIAVLCRGNNGANEIVKALLKRGVHACSASLNIWEHKEIRFVIAWMHLAHNPTAMSNVVFLHDIVKSDVMSYGLGDVWCKSVQQKVSTGSVEFLEVIQNDTSKKAAMFKTHFMDILAERPEKDTPTYVVDLINLILDKSGLLKMIQKRRDTLREAGERDISRSIKNAPEIALLSNRLQRLDDIRDMAVEETFETFMEQSALGNSTIQDDNAVTVMTIHASKGLEWDTVYLYGVSDKNMKTEKSNPDYGEACRLLYVASTRPRKLLFITSADYYYDKRHVVSSLIAEAIEQGLVAEKSAGSGAHSMVGRKRKEDPIPTNGNNFNVPEWFREKIGFESIQDMMRGL